MDFTQKSRMRSIWIKLWWFDREIHSFSFKIILNFKKGPLTYLAAKHCCLIHDPSGDLLKKTKEKSFRPVQYVLCKRLYYREMGLFKYPWTPWTMSHLKFLPTPPARFTGLCHIPSMARRSGRQPNTP